MSAKQPIYFKVQFSLPLYEIWATCCCSTRSIKIPCAWFGNKNFCKSGRSCCLLNFILGKVLKEATFYKNEYHRPVFHLCFFSQ